MTILSTPISRGGKLPSPLGTHPSIGGGPGLGFRRVSLEKVVSHHPPREVFLDLPGPGYREVGNE